MISYSLRKIGILCGLLLNIFTITAHASALTGMVQDGQYYKYPLFEEQANIKDHSLYEFANQDPIGFWNKCAEEITWFKKWDNSLNWNSPFARWYENGKLNACFNCIDRHLINNPNKVALICVNEAGSVLKYTYADLHKKICHLANGLKSLGVQKGDKVAIYMPLNADSIVAMLACARIGAVHSVVFGGIGAGSLKEKINDSNSVVLITADGTYRRGKLISYKSVCDEIIDECSSIKNVIVLKNTNSQINFNANRDIWYHDLVASTSDDCKAEEMDSEDLLFILYTSGTTGKPKGIVHTTGGYMVGVHNTFKWVFDIKSEDIYWSTADIGWITGHSYVVYGPMSNGVTQVIYEGAMDYPFKDRVWNIIETQKVSIFYTAPTLIRTFMQWGTDWLRQSDLSSIRLLGSIGEPLNPEAWHWFSHHVGNDKCPIVDTWFQTETGSFVIAPIPGLTPLKPGSISKPLPGYQATVLNEEGDEAPSGFLAITTPYPSMMRGVFNDPNRFYDTYWKKWDGRFYYAGDSAIKEFDGYLWVGGRADEVIKVSGHRIGTAEIESSLILHPAVAEAAAIGVSDPIKGQCIIALITVRSGMQFDKKLENELKQQVATYVGSFARPERIEVISELPKTRSGKILRRLIRNLIENKPIGDISSLENKSILNDLEHVCIKISKDLRKDK